jgi:hypothetical protein
MSNELGDDYHEGRATMRWVVLVATAIAGVAVIVFVMLLMAQIVIGLR